MNGWYGLVAPGAVRPSLVRILHQSVKQVLADPGIQARFAAEGSEVETSSTPAEFKNLVRSEIAKWEKFARTSGFKAH